jgi:deazaflavin-dependent oxidoreductase (nitroreductase family)
MDQAPRYLKPGWLTSRVLNPLLMRLGMIPTLAVPGRTSGEWRTVPVNVLEIDGLRYLVAPRGDTQWVRNLRATGRGELRRRGRVEPFRATEIPDNEKPRVSSNWSSAAVASLGHSLEELRAAKEHLEATGVELLRLRDHTVSQSIYLSARKTINDGV